MPYLFNPEAASEAVKFALQIKHDLFSQSVDGVLHHSKQIYDFLTGTSTHFVKDENIIKGEPFPLPRLEDYVRSKPLEPNIG